MIFQMFKDTDSIADMTHRYVTTRVLPVKILSCYGISSSASSSVHINRTCCGFIKEIFNVFLKKIALEGKIFG